MSPPSWADGLDAYARPPQSLREPTRWNQDKSPETIYHIHISLYASPADSYSGNYIWIRFYSWQLAYFFISLKCKWTSAYATCLRRKILHCLCACLRMPMRTVKYQVNSLRSCIRSSLEYMRLVIGKKTMLTLGKGKIIFKMPFWGDMLVFWRVYPFYRTNKSAHNTSKVPF